jgi:hypothetical protein
MTVSCSKVYRDGLLLFGVLIRWLGSLNYSQKANAIMRPDQERGDMSDSVVRSGKKRPRTYKVGTQEMPRPTLLHSARQRRLQRRRNGEPYCTLFNHVLSNPPVNASSFAPQYTGIMFSIQAASDSPSVPPSVTEIQTMEFNVIVLVAALTSTPGRRLQKNKESRSREMGQGQLGETLASDNSVRARHLQFGQSERINTINNSSNVTAVLPLVPTQSPLAMGPTMGLNHNSTTWSPSRRPTLRPTMSAILSKPPKASPLSSQPSAAPSLAPSQSPPTIQPSIQPVSIPITGPPVQPPLPPPPGNHSGIDAVMWQVQVHMMVGRFDDMAVSYKNASAWTLIANTTLVPKVLNRTALEQQAPSAMVSTLAVIPTSQFTPVVIPPGAVCSFFVTTGTLSAKTNSPILAYNIGQPSVQTGVATSNGTDMEFLSLLAGTGVPSAGFPAGPSNFSASQGLHLAGNIHYRRYAPPVLAKPVPPADCSRTVVVTNVTYSFQFSSQLVQSNQTDAPLDSSVLAQINNIAAVINATVWGALATPPSTVQVDLSTSSNVVEDSAGPLSLLHSYWQKFHIHSPPTNPLLAKVKFLTGSHAGK